MLLLSVPMSWICFRKAVLKPLCVGKARYSNKEKFGILEENLSPPPPSSSESRSSPILAIEVAPYPMCHVTKFSFTKQSLIIFGYNIPNNPLWVTCIKDLSIYIEH